MIRSGTAQRELVRLSELATDTTSRSTPHRAHSTSTTMSSKRRPKFTQQEIEQQLQHAFLHLFSSISSTGSSEIEQLGPILLNIHKSRQQDAYLKALKAFVAEKEREIEAVCATNYQVSSEPSAQAMHAPVDASVGGQRADQSFIPRAQDFVGSVSALLKVRQGTVSLKHRVVELNEDVQKSGGGVADKVRAKRRQTCLETFTSAATRLS